MEAIEIRAHFDQQLHALSLEREEDLHQYTQRIKVSSFVAQRKNGIAWFPVDVNKTRFDAGERLIVALNRKPEHQEHHQFQSGRLVRVFTALNHQEIGEEVQGVINQVKDKQLLITLNCDEEPHWFRHHQIGVQLLFDDHSYKEMEWNIRQILKLKDPELKELALEILSSREIESNPEQASSLYFDSLNNSQLQAIQKAIETTKVAVIHGPPGTGKTTTLIALITQLCKSEAQLLVCAPSNTAVDLIVEKLLQVGIKALRIGHPARVTQEALNQTLDAQFTQHPEYSLYKELKRKSEEYFDLAHKYKRNFGPKEREQRRLLFHEAHQLKTDANRLLDQIKASIVFGSRVIVSTLVGANHHEIKSLQFKTVLIDEAGQALEPASWIAIKKGKRVILAGDHLQLPPTVKSQAAIKQGLATTLLDRVMRKTGVASMLDTQYRMHQAIMSFPNQYFYQGKLKAAPSNAHHLLDDSPILFLDTAGSGFEEQINPETQSIENPSEVKFLNKFLQEYIVNLATNGIDSSKYTIGIISPYRAQVELLKEGIEFSGFMGGKVATIDGFQGQEKDLIVLSLVRSNSEGEIGFLKDYRRMNVALTRAKKKLIILGDSATLGQDKFYASLVDFFQSNNYYDSVYSYGHLME